MADIEELERRKREHPRYPVPAAASLRGAADGGGFVQFEARITDISLGGMGVIVYDGSIRLAPGMLLKGCHVRVPGRGSLIVDLEVCYALPEIMCAGNSTHRAGFRFLHSDKRIKALFDVFMIESNLVNRPPGHWIARSSDLRSSFNILNSVFQYMTGFRTDEVN